MNRRTALKHFAITGAAAMLLPACSADPKKVSVALDNLKITADDEELMGQLAQTLIPSTDKPGAKEVGAHLFAFVMVDDCMPPDQKESFVKGMKAFNSTAPVPGEKKFLNASAEEKLETLKALEKNLENTEDSIKTFYQTAKGYIIQGYTNSQFFMTEVKPYQLVPGPVYKGCVPLS